MNLDSIDQKILQLLQEDGRLTTVELAEKVNLSPSPCARRLKRLESEGYIQDYRAVLDRHKLGLGMTVFVAVRLSNHREQAVTQFEAAVATLDTVISAHTVSGASDYLLEVVVSDLLAYEKVMKQLQTLNMVQDINSNFAIRQVKGSSALPVG